MEFALNYKDWYKICVGTCSGKLFKYSMKNRLSAKNSLSQTLSMRKSVP